MLKIVIRAIFIGTGYINFRVIVAVEPAHLHKLQVIVQIFLQVGRLIVDVNNLKKADEPYRNWAHYYGIKVQVASLESALSKQSIEFN